MRKAQKKARKLSPGDIVEIKWKDSGREAATRNTDLADRLVYGRVDAVIGDTLRLAMDVCVGDDGLEDGGNTWGFIWIPSILRVTVLS